MTLTFEHDLDRVKMKQRGKYLGQRSFNSKVIVRIYRQTDGQADCSTWTTKVITKDNSKQNITITTQLDQLRCINVGLYTEKSH